MKQKSRQYATVGQCQPTLVMSLRSGLDERMSSDADFLCPFLVLELPCSTCSACLTAAADELLLIFSVGGSGAGLRAFRFYATQKTELFVEDNT